MRNSAMLAATSSIEKAVSAGPRWCFHPHDCRSAGSMPRGLWRERRCR